jgi:hypothetical protein
MNLEARRIFSREGSVGSIRRSDPFEGFLTTTTASGTSLIGYTMGDPEQTELPSSYIAINFDIILEYEHRIIELRQELLHYKRLLSKLLPEIGLKEDYLGPEPVIPMDASSVRVLNSIVSAHIPPSATFRDFNEEEL